MSEPPKQVFRGNLRRLAESYGLDCDGLAAALGWKRDDKKWLARAWEYGLSRPDSRCEDRLRTLATFLGFLHPENLWIPKCTPEPKWLSLTEIGRSVRFGEDEPQKWTELVAHVSRTLRSIHRIWGRYPALMERIQKLYRSEEEMIAYWVAARYGNVALSSLEEQAQQFVADDWRIQQQLDRNGDLVNTLLARLRDSPNWIPMLKHIYNCVGEEWKPDFYFDSDANESVEAEPADLPEEVSRQLTLRIQEVINRPPSMDELVARFEAYLGDDNLSEVDQEVLSIMSELQTYPEWEDHFLHCYDEETTEATARVREDWFKAKMLGFTVEQFVKAYFSARMLERRIDKQNPKSGRVNRKPKKNE